jgi:hypothetical protein
VKNPLTNLGAKFGLNLSGARGSASKAKPNTDYAPLLPNCLEGVGPVTNNPALTMVPADVILFHLNDRARNCAGQGFGFKSEIRISKSETNDNDQNPQIPNLPDSSEVLRDEFRTFRFTI